MNKKILSVVLILCLMLAVMPMTAYAADIALCTKCGQRQTVRVTRQYANDKWHRCDLTCTVCDNTWDYWESHIWSGTATCTSGRTCTVCGGSSEPLGHDWGTWTQNSDEKTHTRICKRDTSHTETENCIGGTATCTQRATCTVCGAEYGDALGHDFTTSWTHDDNEHWKQCSRCDEKDDVSPHTWDSGTVTTAPTCTKAGERTYTCTECGATKIEPIPATGHSWKSDWTSDATHHWHECANKNCDVTDNAGKKGYAEHSGGKATCKAQAVCEICKESYGSLDPNNHTDLKHIDAKAATAAEEGNIEYWYCDGCKKYFSDAAAKTEITKAATVTATPTASPTAQPTTAPQAAEQPRRTAQPTVQPTAAPTVQPVSTIPATGDTSSPILWAALLLCSGAGLAVTAYKKNRHRS